MCVMQNLSYGPELAFNREGKTKKSPYYPPLALTFSQLSAAKGHFLLHSPTLSTLSYP